MKASLSTAAMPVGLCPVQAVRPQQPQAAAVWRVQPGDGLELPLHQRVVLQYASGDDGQRELRLYLDRKEISFDDPAMFAFGEALVRQPHFVAGEATQWGHGYPWATVQPLLQQLLNEGVLQRVDLGDLMSPRRASADGARPSPLPPAPNPRPRTWHEADAVMLELTGRPFDPAYLELVIPIFRVAHMAVDAEGRQVGEANVFPPALRLEVPTRWRECIYNGTRHRSERPMNVAALKSMRAHWPTMMALVLAVRQAYLRRFDQAAAGWTVGHLERLATVVLALPTWLLMRSDGRVPNGALHPALSSLFRVTDGVRMVMHQMLFVPIGEPALDPDAPMTAAEIHAYAERNYSFHSEHGVCAGPQAMVDEFLGVLVDGREPRDPAPQPLDPAIDEALRAIEPALDYGLRGLQAYALVFSLWPSMARSVESLADISAGWAATGSPAAGMLNERWQGHLERLRESSYLGSEERRAHRDRVFADMLAQCTHGLPGAAPGLPLADRLRPQAQDDDTAAEAALRTALQRYAAADPRPGDAFHLQALFAAVMDHLRRTRALIGAASAVQAELNALLGRSSPRRPLTADDLDLHNQLQGAAARHLPYLIHELQAVFGIAISVTATSIAITTPDSAGMGLAVPRT